MDLSTICDIIILIGAVAAAIISIMKLLGKPAKFFKKKVEEERQKENTELTKQITTSVQRKLAPDLEEIKRQNIEQNETVAILVNTTKDLLRKAIMNIYRDNKSDRKLTETEKEMLDDLYCDYRAEHGNSYIEKIYNRMCKWEIVPDED